MSTNPPSVHPDWLQPPPRPGMSASAKVFVGLGIAGGLVSLTACAAVIMGLLERAEMAEVAPVAPAEHVARDLHRPGAETSKGPIVLTPSGDRFAVPPEEPSLGARPQDAQQIVRDRTRVTLQARFVELDLAAAARLAGDAAAKAGLADGGALVQSLLTPAPDASASVLGTAKPADLVAGLPDFERLGVARLLAAPKLTTRHRLPAKIVEEGRPDAARPRPCSTTVQIVPEVLDGGEVALEVSAQISKQVDGETRPQTSSATTRVEMHNGQTLAIGGLVTRSGDGAKNEVLVILLTAEVQAPVGPEAATALTEAELRGRREQQCRFVQDEIARQFPESKVELVAAAGKLFVRGTAKDDEQLTAIVAAVRGRVAAWQIVDGPVVPTGGDAPPDNPNVVVMLRRPQAPQVLVRMRLFELDRGAAAKAVRDGGQRADDYGLLAALVGLDDARRSAVLDGLEGDKLEAAMKALQGRGLVRVLSEPTLVTVSRRKATLHVGDEVSLADAGGGHGAPAEPPEKTPAAKGPTYQARARAAVAERRESYPCGTIIHALPVVLDQDRIRVEVTRDFQRLVEDGRQGDPARLVLSSQGLTAVAVMRSGQTLAVGDVGPGPAEEKEGRAPGAAEGAAQQFLLVTAEIVGPLEAKPSGTVARAVGAEPPARPATPTQIAPPPDPGPRAEPPRPAGRRSLREFFGRDDRPAREQKPDAPAGKKAGTPPTREGKVQVLQEVLRDLFPKSEVSLDLDGASLTVVGQASDAAEAAQIMAVVREEAQKLEPQTGALHVLDRVRTTAAEKVTMRVTFLELNPSQVRNSPEFLQPRSREIGRLAGSLAELAEKGGRVALDPAACGDVAEGIRILASRHLVRVLSEETPLTESGRACRVAATVATAGTSEGEAAGSSRRSHLAGRTVTLLPTVVGQRKVRLEVRGESGAPERMTPTDQARPLTLAAELPLGATLAMSGLWEEAEEAKSDRSGSRLIVLVTPELPRTGPAEPRARADGSSRRASLAQPGAENRAAEPGNDLRITRTPPTERSPRVTRRPAAPATAPDEVKAPSPPGFDVAESPGPEPRSQPAPSRPAKSQPRPSRSAEPQPAESGGAGRPNILDRLKAIKLPFHRQSGADDGRD